MKKIIKRMLWRLLKLYGSCDFSFYKYGIKKVNGRRYRWAFRAMHNYLHVNWYGKECHFCFTKVGWFPF